MKHLQKFIIIIVCLIILILMILIFLNKKDGNTVDTDSDKNIAATDNVKKSIGVQMSEYVIIKNCINQYLDLLSENNENGENIPNKIYFILDESYIKQNNITLDNLLQKIGTIKENVCFTPIEIINLSSENSGETSTYKVKGIKHKNDYNNEKIGEEYYVVNICIKNGTFSMHPIDEKEYGQNLKNTITLSAIENNGYNVYIPPEAGWQAVSGEYFEIYRNLMLLSPNEIYNRLAKEYKEKRFKDLKSFEDYAKENSEKIRKLRFSKYLVNYASEYTQYVCQDQYGNSYIFQEKDVNNYTILLDTYTVDLPEFLEKYNKATDQVKVGMNAEKIISAINNKDYNYIYNHLNETFKTNSVKTIENLQRYIESRLFEHNDSEYIEFSEEGSGVYAYKIKVKSMDDAEKYKNMTIVMKLKEGTDFEMSFSIE